MQQTNKELTEGNAQLQKEKESLAATKEAGSATAARVAELTDAVAKARDANSQYAEANQRLELEKARLEQELSHGSETGKLVEQLREQSRRLSEQLQSATADREAAQRETAVLAAQVKDVQQELAQQKAAAVPAPAAPAVDVSKYESQIAALTARLEQATGSLSQLQQTNQQLTEGNAQLLKEKETLAATAKAAPAADAGKYPVQESDKDAIIANLQRDKARLNDEVKRSTIELLALNQQIRNLRNQTAKPAEPEAADNAASARIRTDNQRVDNDNTRLQAQRDAAVGDAETLKGQLGDARAEITRLNEQMAQLRATRQSADAANDQLAQLTTKAAQAAEETGRLQQENSRLTTRIAELEKQPAPAADRSLPSKLAQAEQTAARLQRQVESLQADKAGLEQLNRTQEKNLRESAASAQTAGTEAADLRQKLAQARKQIEEQGTALAAQEKNAGKLERENRSLAEKVTAGQADQVQVKARVATLEDDLRIARKKASGGTGGLDELKKQLANANESLHQSAATVAELTASAQSGQQELTQARAQVAGLQQQLATARQAAEDTGAMRDELNQLRREATGATTLREQHAALVAKTVAEHDNLMQAQARVAALEKDLQNASSKPAGDTAALEDLKRQLAEANQALEKNGATVAELTAANDRLDKELAAVKQAAAEAGPLRVELEKLKGEAGSTDALREENLRLRKVADEAATLRAKNQQLTRDSDQLAGLVTGNRHELDEARTRVAELEKLLEEARTSRTGGTDDSRKLRNELAEANQSIEKLNATVAELTGTNDRLEQDLDSARKSTAAALAAQSQAVSAAQPDAYKMEISTLQAHVKELEGQMEEERNNTAKEIATMASQLQRTRETNKSLTEANRALLNAKQAEQPTVDKDQFDQLQAKVHDLMTAGEEMKRQNEKLAADNQNLAAERAALKQLLDDAHKVATTLPGLSEEKAALQERLEAVGGQLMKSQQEVDALQKDNADAVALAAASKQAADKAQAELAALQNRATEAEKASESHNASVAELTQANTKLEQEREDMRRLVESYRADINRLTQNVRSAEQLKVEAERGAQQNIDAVTAQLGQLRRDLENTRTAQARLAEANATQERERAAIITQLRTENGALAARLNQAQSTLDQIAAAARLGTPAATIASGGAAPVRPVPVASTPQPAEVRYHTVAEGDSLSRISLRYYGTPNRWQDIFQANRDVLQGSSALRVGMQLRIP